jgi:uncharacterized protein (TIGR02145 family)
LNTRLKINKLMKNEYYITVRLLLIFIVMIACEKEEKIVLPTVDTASVDEIYNTSARVGGRVADNGGADITERGVYWGTSASPETSGTKLQVGTGTGIFYDILSGLSSGVKYYVKAYAVNTIGTSYGNETFFTTQISLPTILTAVVTDFTSTSARVGGNISDNGGFEVTQRGVFWGTEPDPRLTGTKLVIGSGSGDFSQILTGLSSAITYYVVAFATNLKGTVYGNELNFSTQPGLPQVSTATISDIKAYSAKVGGNISSSGGADITDRGVYWGLLPEPQSTGTKLKIGSGTGNFIDTLENLNPGVTYYVMAYASNAMGTSYGEAKNYTTLGAVPAVRNLNYTDLTANSIILNGLVSANDLSTTVTFEYGTTDSYGNISEYANNPVTEDVDTVSANIVGLQPQTLYHFRIKAENDLGAVYSEDLTFTTVITGITGTVPDSEGNTYKTIGIGYQEWMTENLKSAKFNDGDSIPLIVKDSLWRELSTPGLCWYNNDEGNKNTYGALYNWYAVSGNKKLCPSGWHVPTNEDITTLVEYLGGASKSGGLLKETGNNHWNSPNAGATDEYSFTALGGGKRLADGSFDFMKVEGNWWSSTEYSAQNASYLYILFSYSNSFQAYFNKKTGMSVRCVKD